jgi:hypothetical protein
MKFCPAQTHAGQPMPASWFGLTALSVCSLGDT